MLKLMIFMVIIGIAYTILGYIEAFIYLLFTNVVDYELQRSPWEAKLVNNSFKKARKRSKHISEIDTPGINEVHFCSSMVMH
jgi:hypothetical protein